MGFNRSYQALSLVDSDAPQVAEESLKRWWSKPGSEIGTAERTPMSAGKITVAVCSWLAAVEAIGRRVNDTSSSRTTGDCTDSDEGGIISAAGGTQKSGTAAIGSEGLAEEGFEDDAMEEECEIDGCRMKKGGKNEDSLG